ncbi:hypothetical protein GCM10010307_72280 [Streptomyces vastus]|uniref:Uncharacterized protein n=1 Tax=Streptomyces vastus TaxID=285451 RepID=A0ABN3RPJ9_9ACTN
MLHTAAGLTPLVPTGHIPESPVPISPETAKLRARIAGRRRQDPNADITEEQRELKTLTLEERIRRVVESAPPLTADQIERLRALLPPVE